MKRAAVAVLMLAMAGATLFSQGSPFKPDTSRPLVAASDYRGLAQVALELGPLGRARRARRAESRHAGEEKGRGGAGARRRAGVPVVERPDPERSGRALPERVGHGGGVSGCRDRSHRVPVHSRRGHDAHRLAGAHLLRRRRLERCARRRGRDEGARRPAAFRARHEGRDRHARGPVRHPAAEGRAVPRARHAHLSRRSRGLGEAQQASPWARATRCCFAGGGGRAAGRSAPGLSIRGRPDSTTA